MSNRFKAVVVGLGMAVIATGATLPAAADVYIRTYAGTNCVEEYGGTSIITPSIAYLMGSAMNNATTTKIFICPTNSPPYIATGTDAVMPTKAYWWAKVYDGNSTADFSCQLISCADTGAPCTFGPFRTTTGTGAGSLSTIGDIGEIGGYWKQVYLRCQIPGRVGSTRSSISSYTLYAFE